MESDPELDPDLEPDPDPLVTDPQHDLYSISTFPCTGEMRIRSFCLFLDPRPQEQQACPYW